MATDTDTQDGVDAVDGVVASSLDALDDSPPEFVQLKASDDTVFEVKRADVMLSGLLRTTLEQDENATEIEALRVDGATMSLVVDYFKHHQGKAPRALQKPLSSTTMSEVVTDPWDAEFIDAAGAESIKVVYNLMLAANYMDIPPLLNLCAAKVASLVKGQPVDEIAKILTPA